MRRISDAPVPATAPRAFDVRIEDPGGRYGRKPVRGVRPECLVLNGRAANGA
jgi:hypothetical protein